MSRKRIALIIFLILFGVILGWWQFNSYELEESLDDIMEHAEIGDDYIVFAPEDITNTKTGIILYPGALIEHDAYIELAYEISRSGHLAVIVDVPINLAIFDKDAATKVIEDYKDIDFVVGGHSLGGYVASEYVASNDNIKGLVLLSAYPDKDTSISSQVEILSIYGSIDGVVNFGTLKEAKARMPEDTTYVEIEGGNHSQFGNYGLQRGDNEAEISYEEQLEITVREIDKLIKKAYGE